MTTPTTDISPLGLTRHSVKTHPLPFAELCKGVKTAEIRRLDRGYAVGHEVLLQEFDPLTQDYTGNALPRTITHIQEGYGLPEGVGVLSYGEVTAKIEQMSIADEQESYTEKDHFVAEYMLQKGFEMVDDNGDVFACRLAHILELLKDYSAPMFAENVASVDANWLTQLRNEFIAAGDLANKHATERDNLQLQVDTLTCALRKIIKTAKVDQEGANIETPGPDLMALAVDVLTKLQEPQVFPMEEAPTDGTRVLIKARQHGFDSTLFRHVPRGESWLECHFFEGQWREWCGAFNISSTTVIDPLEWAHLPDAGLMTRTEAREVWAQPAPEGKENGEL